MKDIGLRDASPLSDDTQGFVAGLVASHGKQLRRFLAGRVPNVADVPDMFQEVYLRMLRIPNRESIRSPGAYLFVVAQHVLHQHTLRDCAGSSTVELAYLQATAETDPLLEANAQQCLERLQAALDRLAPKVRATFMLSRRDGLSIDEIAERLGTTRGMVNKYVTKAVVQLREQFEPAG